MARTRMTKVFRPFVCGLALLCLAVGSVSKPLNAQAGKNRNGLPQLQEKHRKKYRDFADKIKKLAAECEEKGLKDEAEQVRSRAFVPETQSLQIEKLPAEVRPVIAAEDRAWEKQQRSLETAYAKELYLHSRLALESGYPSYAYNLVREAALHDPDDPKVRKILGYERLKSEWLTPFAAAQIRKGNVWHYKYGWIPALHEARYAAGERNFKGAWISEEKERESRRDFKEAWQVRTDHYLIKTNVSLESGVELGKALEDFHDMFNETFAGFFNTPEQLKKLFDEAKKSTGKVHEVHFYRTRDEYLDKLRKQFPAIDQTNGIYLTSDQKVHFYQDSKQDNLGTLFHEATHQLFYESQRGNRTICEKYHFWIIEGIACYMESFQRTNGAFTLGDPKYIRFVKARENLLQNKYYIPLQEFSGMGMQQFQNQPPQELARNYTQASGLARFFMHFDNGRYREALVRHLTDLYSGDRNVRENAAGLNELTGVEFSELDSQYAAEVANWK